MYCPFARVQASTFCLSVYRLSFGKLSTIYIGSHDYQHVTFGHVSSSDCASGYIQASTPCISTTLPNMKLLKTKYSEYGHDSTIMALVSPRQMCLLLLKMQTVQVSVWEVCATPGAVYYDISGGCNLEVPSFNKKDLSIV